MAVTTAVVVGIAASATSAGMSFSQARQQKKLAQQAKQDANEAMAAARKKLQVNYYDKLAVQKEPYELQREALLSQGAQALQAGVEGESRGAAAVAGRVAMAQNEAQAGVRTAMGKEMGDLEKLSAQEDSRLRDIGIQLDLGEVEGAQAAAANAEVARANAMAQGMQSVTSLAQQGMQLAPLYSKNLGAQKAALGKMEFTPEQFAEFEKLGGKPLKEGEFSSLDFGGIAGMNNAQYRQFKNSLSPEQRNFLFQNEQYLQNYGPNPFLIY